MKAMPRTREATNRVEAPRRTETGFTLLELVIIVAIIVIASGFVILNLEGVTSSGRLRSAGRTLANHLVFARGTAIVVGAPVYIYYDLDENKYYMTRRYYGEERGAPRHEELRYTEDEWDFPRGVRLHSVVSVVKKSERGIERFEMTPFGACVSHCVYLKGPEEKDWITVEVNGITGRVAIYQYYKEFDGVLDSIPGL